MKRILIGGFTALIGSIWALTFTLLAAHDYTNMRLSPPREFLSTLSHLGLMPFYVLSVAVTLFGLVLLMIELFKKES